MNPLRPRPYCPSCTCPRCVAEGDCRRACEGITSVTTREDHDDDMGTE